MGKEKTIKNKKPLIFAFKFRLCAIKRTGEIIKIILYAF